MLEDCLLYSVLIVTPMNRMPMDSLVTLIFFLKDGSMIEKHIVKYRFEQYLYIFMYV